MVIKRLPSAGLFDMDWVMMQIPVGWYCSRAQTVKTNRILRYNFLRLEVSLYRTSPYKYLSSVGWLPYKLKNEGIHLAIPCDRFENIS
jgi:hypothetical protein